jgi:hypothetical protein
MAGQTAASVRLAMSQRLERAASALDREAVVSFFKARSIVP